MDRAAQTETPTAEQTQLKGVAGVAPVETAPQSPTPAANPDSTPQPFSITGLAQETPPNAVSSMPAVESPTQSPTPINTEVNDQTQTAQPDIVQNQTPAESMASYQPAATEAPANSTPDPAQPAPEPVTGLDPNSAQVPSQPAIHEPKTEQELKDLENFGVGTAPLEDNKGDQISDSAPVESTTTPQNPQAEATTQTAEPEMEGISEMELQALFKDLDPKTRGNSIRAFKLFNAYKKLSGGDKDALKSSADALHDTLTDISLKAMEPSEPKPAQQENQPSS